MKKIILILIFISFGLTILSLFASAAPLEYPLPFLQNRTDPSPCDYIRALYIWGLGIVGVLAVTTIAVGGFLYMTGQAQKGRDYILSALLGLLLLLGSWLLLNTINPDLAKLKCDLPQQQPAAPGPAAPSGPTPPSPTTTGGMTEQAARNRLTQSNIGFKNDCPQGQWNNCVDLEGVREPVLNEVISLATPVGANNVYITAGTEGCGIGGPHGGGLNGHCGGRKVDLRPNPTLNNYIETNYTYIGERSGDRARQYRSPSGAIYARESDHWDVLVSG